MVALSCVLAVKTGSFPQLSHGAGMAQGSAAAVAENASQLADILKFGLDHLLQSEEG